MKKIFSLLTLVLLMSLMFTSCSLDMPRPKIKEGRFDISVTYEVNGEVKTVDAVYVCQYRGVWWTLEGVPYRAWDGNFEGDIITDDVIDVCATDDGGKIFLCFLIYPEYFMGEPDYENYEPVLRPNLIYYEGENGTISEINEDEALIAEEYGVRIISFEYDEPIDNSFSLLHF